MRKPQVPFDPYEDYLLYPHIFDDICTVAKFVSDGKSLWKLQIYQMTLHTTRVQVGNTAI